MPYADSQPTSPHDPRAKDWVILHGGALGDLVLTVQLALRLPAVNDTGVFHILSRVDPGDLSACRPQILRTSSETAGLHWLFGDHDDPPPAALRERLRGHRVLSALGGPHTIAHQRLADLCRPGSGPVSVHSFDPRPRPGVQRHITEQWRSQLEDYGLLIPKCVHQRPQERGLGVPPALRTASAAVIHPGSGGRGKCWPLANFIELARALRDAPHFSPLQSSAATANPIRFVIGHVELETWPREDLHRLAELEAEFPVLRAPAQDDLVALLAGADLYIGNDSGPTHLATLLGTRTVALFGPTSAAVWRPLGPRAGALQGDPAAGPAWGLDVVTVAHTALAMATTVQPPG